MALERVNEETAWPVDDERNQLLAADFYLNPLYQAEQLVLEKRPGVETQRYEFLLKLTAYRNLFKRELTKELAKGDKADQSKINDAKEIAVEYYEMTKILCDSRRSAEEQQQAIDKAYERSTKNFWWNFFGLKLLKISLLAAAAALVGFMIGYTVGNLVGGTLLGYKFATAATSAYVGGMFGASALGKVGSSIGTYYFFYTPLEKKAKEIKNAAKHMKADINRDLLVDNDLPLAVVQGPRQ